MFNVIKKILENMWDDAFDDIPSDIHALIFICNLLSCVIFACIDHLLTKRDVFEEILFVVVAMVFFFLIYSVCVFARYVAIKAYEEYKAVREK